MAKTPVGGDGDSSRRRRDSARKAPAREPDLGPVVEVLRAIRAGRFSARLPEGFGEGQMRELAVELNAIADQNEAMTREFERVSVVVGQEGRLDERAALEFVSGSWASMTSAFNSLIARLVWPTTEATRVLRAVSEGDLSQRMALRSDGKSLHGDILVIGETLNTVVDRLRAVSSEVTRVAREVGQEGKLGVQADMQGVSGAWRDLTDNVNMLAGNLTTQVRNIALVTTAVANGDLSKKITVEAQGEIRELKNTVNIMVDQLGAFAAEVTRVAREVGTEGKLGGQAGVKGLSGTWKDLTDNVNMLAGNLTSQVRNIALVTTAVANGDLSQKITVEAQGEIRELKNTVNAMVDRLRTFAAEVTRVAREVGTEGRLGGQAHVLDVAGTWKDLTDNVNLMASNLTAQVRGIGRLVTSVANGDLTQRLTIEARGEIASLVETINNMTDTLRVFAEQVITVAREVGTEGTLGGQAKVPGVAGTWQVLTDSVNVMASNLTGQVRGIVKVVTAVATGDLSQKFVVEAKGEIAALAETINDMTDTLRTFAEQVITVAREVGIEGKLGGQARVPGAAGTWRDLTVAVNQLAGNLTTQVRAISEVATAVIEGDLTQSIKVEALGEVLALKDTINQMIANLRDTTRTNREQNWLKTNLAKFSSMMQGQRTLESLSQQIMSELTPTVEAQHGAFFVAANDQQTIFKMVSSYAHMRRKRLSHRFELGEGLVGQCALERKPILVTELPEDYVTIGSGLGEAPPRNLIVLPVVFEGKVKAVIELGSFHEFTSIHLTFLEQLMQSIGVVYNMIGASMRTEELLQELQRSNTELASGKSELEEKAELLEVKNREIAEASASLAQKANELTQVSRYKSEFLANMSHEIRTPLNSMLILAQLLAANEENTLTPKQQEEAQIIYSSGRDLLALINQILDLSKIEAGKVEVSPGPVSIAELGAFIEQTFLPASRQKGLDFSVRIATDVPDVITTDRQLLQQILTNLVSNAIKFTDHGRVGLDVRMARPAAEYHRDTLKRAEAVIAFAISDTGIGIPKDKQQLIFEAFQQADASTARKFGGTGLGLAIARELATVLGGEIDLQSTPSVGSVFTILLPVSAKPQLFSQRGAEPKHVPEPLVTEKDEAPASFTGKKVIVVDDDARGLYAMTTLLERVGVTVLSASNAEECFEALQRHPDVALVFMDIAMPEIDGLQATRQIRAMPPFAELPIVALTAKASGTDVQRCLAAGCTDYLSKPADVEHLMALLTKYLKT